MAKSLLVVLVVVAFAAPCLAQCDASYQCGFTISDPAANNAAFTFDFSPLCAANDYVAQDTQGHTYYANVCKYAQKTCLPADCDNYPYCVPWQNKLMNGVAVQMWGQKPPNPPMDPSLNCHPYNAPTTTAPCTRACQVLGAGSPAWSLTNPSDPHNSDVLGVWRGLAPTTADPFYCPNDPTTGLPQERQVHMIFQCAPGVKTAQMYEARQNTTEACHYRLYFKTQHACMPGGLSGGSVFIILVVVAAFVYFVGGALFMFLRTGKFDIPHRTFWVQLPSLCMDGVAFARDSITGQHKSNTSFHAVGGAGDTAAATGFESSTVSYQSYDDAGEAQEMGNSEGGAAAAYADL